jgi:Raf kinase inhibitor-like YbhB/YbcL family protein
MNSHRDGSRDRAAACDPIGVVRILSLAVLLFAAVAHAQQRGAQPPPATPGGAAQPGAPGQRGGGGRGRGAVQVMSLTTTAWADGGTIPIKYSQAGDESSPPLAWTNAPDGVVSYVLLVHDVDAPIGTGTDDLLQWMLWNIPPTVTAIHERAPSMAQLPDGTRQISATGPCYRGPGALASGPPHHYVFELFALDTLLDIPAVGASPPQTRAAVVTAMAGHVRGKATMVGLFKRPS